MTIDGRRLGHWGNEGDVEKIGSWSYLGIIFILSFIILIHSIRTGPDLASDIVASK